MSLAAGDRWSCYQPGAAERLIPPLAKERLRAGATLALGAAAVLRVAVAEPAGATVAVAAVSAALVGTGVAVPATVIVAVRLTLTLSVTARRDVAIWL